MKSIREQELERRLKQLIQHIGKTKKKCQDHNLWLIAGYDSLKDATDEVQQGPLINRLYDLVEDNKRFLKDSK